MKGSTFRAKLFSLGAVAALGLVILTITGSLVERSVDRHLETIRAQYIPKIGLADQLAASFERVSRGLQDAANASDAGFLDEAKRREALLLDQVSAARGAIDPARISSVRAAIEDYYASAEATTRKTIKGTTGEGFIDEVKAMQTKQAAVAKLLDDVSRFDERGLTDAFAAASDAQDAGAQIRLGISLACIAIVLALSVWIARGMYRGLGELTEGLRRFGEGDLGTPIPATRNDELGDVANNANQMANRLRKMDEDRDRGAWIKAAQVGLGDSVRGELSTEEVSTRALDYLARYVGAPVGVIYFAGPDDVLRPLASHGLTAARRAALPSFAFGDGLVGEAARGSEPRVIRGAESHLAISSGTGDSAPGALVFVPIVLAEKVRGVIELGAMTWDARETELALSVRETIGIAIDVARNRAAMRDLLAETQRQASELLAARQGLEEQARELARASTYKSQFLANMSHELRTPLNAILGFSELLHDGAVPPDSPQHKEFLADVIASGRHLLQLINDILDLSKIEAGKLEFRAELVDVRAAIDEVLATLKTVAIAARVGVEANVAAGIGDVFLDRVRLKQVLYNYISNAIKFTPEGGRVTIAAIEEGPDRVKFAVTDNGIGIAPAELHRLFGEFQQLTGDGKQRGGTGLGLALTKRLVEVQGGSVGVASVVGEGSTFHAVLPRDARQVTGDVEETVANKRAPSLAIAAAPSVLVVEDDLRDRAEIVAALEAGGYLVKVAGSGAEALAYLREQTFDAVTLDLVLPDMNGMDVLKRLRAGGDHRDVPVIVLTVVAEKGAVGGFAVDAILQKPLDPEQLLGALRRAGVGTRGTVMIVDDDPGALKLMASTLGSLGYATRCERDAEVALASLAREAPSAIVLDLLMPGMSGFEFLDRLRRGATAGDRRIPVIVWTSKDLTIGETATLRASASAVVLKGARQGPSVVEELAALLPRRDAHASRDA